MTQETPTPQLDSEPFMELLTDALRAGPGSPQWHQAVGAVRAARHARLHGGAVPDSGLADEYALLCAAREDLESGKDYRSVHAGPGFARKLNDALDDTPRGWRRLLSANIIASIAIALILILGAVFAVVMLRNLSAAPPGIEELANTSFARQIVATQFDANGPVPTPWNVFGNLPLAIKNPAGLRPQRPATLPTTSPQAREGGIVSAIALPPQVPVCADISLRLAHAPDEGIVQVFISDTPATGEMTAAHELVWLLQAGKPSVVLPDGTFAAVGSAIGKVPDLSVRFILKDDLVIIETGGMRLYAGAAHLDASRPRFLGVRFVQKPGEKTADRVSVTAITIKKP